ncbi:MAG: 5'-3' exonuclease [Malacoplasma sp.]
MKNKALIIDGNCLMFRAYYGTLSQLDYYIKNDKTPANAIKLMMLQMFKLLSNSNYKYAIIAFDHKDKNFRKELFDNYKSQRKQTPIHLIEQIEPIKKIMPLFGIKTMCVSGIEADDLIGSAVKLFSSYEIESDVYSADNDMLQLVSKHCNVVQFKKGLNDTITYNVNNFMDLFHNLSPSQIIDYKAISGDPSDNIPGLKGIGPKTTINLLRKFKSIDDIFVNINLLDNDKIKNMFLENKESLFFFKKLIKILDNALDTCDVEDFRLKSIQLDNLKKVIEKFGFSGFGKYIF